MWKIPLFKIYWDEEDVKSVAGAIASGMNWAVGPNIDKFEKMIAEYIGTKYCVVFNSGTSALHDQLLAHGIGKGDEVVVPSFTFIATANSALFVGAKPVFADIEEETLGLDPEDVEKKITRKTKAILPIHYGGCPCKIRELKRIAEDHNLLLIEDAAESFGAKIEDRKVGTFGDSAMFSFCQNKIITTGDGGAVVTDSRDVYEKSKLIRAHGRAENGGDYFSSIEYMDYITLGYNFRMSNIVAALGIAQLEKVDKIIDMRRRNAEYFIARIESQVRQVATPKPPEGYHHVYQMFVLRADHRDELMKYLASKGIMTKVYFSPVHLTQFYKKELNYKCRLPVTEELATQVLTLPLHPTSTKEETDYVVEEMKRFFEGKST